MEKVKIFTRSLGCPKNLVDTENILGGFGDLFEPAADISGSHAVLINTCAFIRPAVEESLDVIFSAYQEIKGLEKKPLLAVTGCLVSRYGPGLGREIPEADIFCGIDEQKNLAGTILARLGYAVPGSPSMRRVSTPVSYAYLKISEGCSNKCSFCTIPSIRGRLKSRASGHIIEEARRLLDRGTKELILVAQDSTAYGRDTGSRDGLAGLVNDLGRLEGLERLRVMYLYPSGLSRKLLEQLASSKGPFLPYFDVPLQHSHPDVLKKMGRPFKDDPWKVIHRIRDVFPEAAIRTTLITGFPGETEEHFRHLVRFVQEACFHHLGVFPFYPEQGSRASELPRQVSPAVSAGRADRIMRIQKKISRSILEAFEDEVLEILVDSPHGEWPGLFTGRAWFQAPEIDGMTYVSGPDAAPGGIIRCRVQNTGDYDLTALQE